MHFSTDTSHTLLELIANYYTSLLASNCAASNVRFYDTTFIQCFIYETIAPFLIYLCRLIEIDNLILNCEGYTIVRKVYTADSIEMIIELPVFPTKVNYLMFTLGFTYLHTYKRIISFPHNLF